METKQFLEVLCNNNGPSGYECNLQKYIIPYFEKYADEIEVDNLGNIIALKKGCSKNKIKIMLAAHMDEIGLIITDIKDNGALKFSQLGGIDQRTLLGQEVIVHGKKDLFGVIGAKPPHFENDKEKNKSIKMEDLTIDIGLSVDKVKKLVNIGDCVTIKRNLNSLQGKRVTGKSLDDKTGIATMFECLKELSHFKHEADVYFVSTVQEEVGCRGALVSTYKINPDIGIAIDVGFGYTPDISKQYGLDMGKGPGITIGGNIHTNLRKKLVKLADEYNIPYQTEVEPGPTGTDANAMQITRQGIPALCLSIPLRYMHTSVEIIDIEDIKNTAKLLALFISSICNENLEGLLCY